MDSPKAEASFGLATMTAWALVVLAVGNLGTFPIRPETSDQSGIPWLVTGTLGFALFSACSVLRSRSGRPLVPLWSLILPCLVSGLFLTLYLALVDEGRRASFADGPPDDKYFWPRLEDWTSEISFLVTLAVTAFVVVDRIFKGSIVTKCLVVAAGALPYPVVAILIAPEL